MQALGDPCATHIFEGSVDAYGYSEDKGAHDNTVSGPPSAETIFIPLEARGKPLAEFSVSVRLRHVLGSKDFKLVGDLHGLPFSKFGRYPNCGKKTLGELRKLVCAIQHGHHDSGGRTGTVVQEWPAPATTETFFIPSGIQYLKVSDLPLSVRLEGVLKRKGARRLGDLHGVSLEDLKKVGNCGRKTILEVLSLIQRAAAGEFSSGAGVPWSPSELVWTLDTLIAYLPDRNEEILVLRLGGSGDQMLTLEDIGARFRLTRARVGQIVDRSIERIRRRGGPRLKSHLERVERFCHENICPLTPALLKLWLQESPGTSRFGFVFYVRLLAELRPTIPAWPMGQDASGSRSGRTEEIERGVEAVLRAGWQALPLAEVLSRLHARADSGRVKTTEFLATLRHSRSLRVEFPNPDAPVVRLTRISPSSVAKAILEGSSLPLTPEEILARANSIVGATAARWNPRRLEHVLAVEKGFYLLGPRSFGLRRHILLPEETWEEIRADFRDLLRRENRPISTAEVTNLPRFRWARQTNTYELACILREDDRLVDLGRFLFALADWGIEEREYIKDLIPRVLQMAGRPLMAAQVLERLQQLRSVSPTLIPGLLRRHSEVRDYGFGHFGLKSWGDSVKGGIVTDADTTRHPAGNSAPHIRAAVPDY